MEKGGLTQRNFILVPKKVYLGEIQFHSSFEVIIDNDNENDNDNKHNCCNDNVNDNVSNNDNSDNESYFIEYVTVNFYIKPVPTLMRM